MEVSEVVPPTEMLSRVTSLPEMAERWLENLPMYPLAMTELDPPMMATRILPRRVSRSLSAIKGPRPHDHHCVQSAGFMLQQSAPGDNVGS